MRLRHRRQEREPAATTSPAETWLQHTDSSAQHRRGHLTCAPLSGRYHLLQRHLPAPRRTGRVTPPTTGPPALQEAASPGGPEDKVAGQRFSCSRAGQQPSALIPPRCLRGVRTLGGSHGKAGKPGPRPAFILGQTERRTQWDRGLSEIVSHPHGTRSLRLSPQTRHPGGRAHPHKRAPSVPFRPHRHGHAVPQALFPTPCN